MTTTDNPLRGIQEEGRESHKLAIEGSNPSPAPRSPNIPTTASPAPKGKIFSIGERHASI